MNKRIIIIFALFSVVHIGNSQNVPNNFVVDLKNMPTPNVAEFNKYSKTSVSFFSGIPQIEVPIYNIALDYINIPITLANSPTGFKPEVHPSWVGMGWNLNAGGVITREVKFVRDEQQSLNDYFEVYGGIGFYLCHNILNEDTWAEVKDIESYPSLYPGYRYDMLDKSPDIFSFNFLGYSGKFFLNHEGVWKVQCDHPLKITFDDNDMSLNSEIATGTLLTFFKFTIVDEKGIQYIFGGENAVEFSSPMIPPGYSYKNGWTSTSWHLREIITPKGERVYFKYERGPYQSSFTFIDKPTSVIARNNVWAGEESHNYIYTGRFAADGVTNEYVNCITGSITSPVYLKEIECPSLNLKIQLTTSKSNELSYFETTYTDFYLNHPLSPGPIPYSFLGFDAALNIPYFQRNPDDKGKINPSVFKERFIWLKLDNISFFYSGVKSKDVTLHFRENPKYRLRLDSLSFSYPPQSKEEVYSFEYHPSLDYMNRKEFEYLSEYSDHWGFSNLKFLWDMNVSSAKAPIQERAKFGMLSKIKYPLGGYTIFVYENHDYNYIVKYENTFNPALEYISDSFGKPVLAGGLRIKRILNVDNLGHYDVVDYEYKLPNSSLSSGIVYSTGLYSLGDNSALFDNGNHIKYSHVAEKYEDGSFKCHVFSTERAIVRLGKTSTGILDDSPLRGTIWEGYIPYSIRSHERGKLLDEYYCNPDGKIVKSKHIFYSNLKKDASNFVRTIDPYYNKRFMLYNIAKSTQYGERAVCYYLYTYYCKPTFIYEVTYTKDSNLFFGYDADLSSSQALVSEQTFEYDDYGQIFKAAIKNSSGQSLGNVVKYAYSTVTPSAVLKDMVNRNMLSFPIEEKSYLNNLFQKGISYTYSYFGSAIVLNSLRDIHKDNSEVLRYSDKYGVGNNLIERTYNTGLIESYLWDTNASKLKAIVRNASISQISSVLTYASMQGGMLSNDWESDIESLRTSLPNAHISSFDYFLNGKLRYRMDEKKEKYNYEYDGNERLNCIKDNDQKIVQSFTYNHTSQSIQDIYLNNSLTISASKQCPEGYTSSPAYIHYPVEEGLIFSSISQEDADNKARLKFQDEAVRLADEQCGCIPYGIYDFEPIFSDNPRSRYDLYTFSGYYEQEKIYIQYLALSWVEVGSNDYYWYNEGVIIGKIQGTMLPSFIKYVEFIDDRATKNGGHGNSWIFWIDTSGFLHVKLKNPNVDRMPEVGEVMTFSFEIDLENSVY